MVKAHDTETELKKLKARPGTTDVLFEVEPPNLFRDPLVEQRLAANTVKRITKHAQGTEKASELVRKVREAMTKAEEVVKPTGGESPLDEKFDLKRKARLRMEIWKSLL